MMTLIMILLDSYSQSEKGNRIRVTGRIEVTGSSTYNDTSEVTLYPVRGNNASESLEHI